MVVRPEGNSISSSALQLENALESITVTVDGMLTLERMKHVLNVDAGMVIMFPVRWAVTR